MWLPTDQDMEYFWHPRSLPYSPSQSILSVSVFCGCHTKFITNDHKLSSLNNTPYYPTVVKVRNPGNLTGFSASGLTRPKPSLLGSVRFQAHAQCWRNSFPSHAFHGGSGPSHTLNLSNLLVPPARKTPLRAYVIRSVLSGSSLSLGVNWSVTFITSAKALLPCDIT